MPVEDIDIVDMTQKLLQHMAAERILDAGALRQANRCASAYYLAGYAVECALKSCVLAQMVHTGGVFRDKKFAEWCWTHDFVKLVEHAGLKPQLEAELKANPAFVGFWNTKNLRKEASRYEQKTQLEAEELYLAITDNADGVMRWIRNYW